MKYLEEIMMILSSTLFTNVLLTLYMCSVLGFFKPILKVGRRTQMKFRWYKHTRRLKKDGATGD